MLNPAASIKGLIFERKDNDVAQSSSAAHQIASRYAAAFIDTAQAANSLDSIEKDMTDLAAMLDASSDLQKLVSSPAYSIEQQIQALGALAKSSSFNALTQNFLQVLAHNRRLSVLKNIISAFAAEMSSRRGEVKAKVATAVPLTEDQQKELKAELKKSMGRDVVLELKVDKSLLGGMVVTIGSKQVDDSVKTKLSALKKALTSNQNVQNLKEVG